MVTKRCRLALERCDYELVKVFEECGNDGYIIYRIALGCGKRAPYLVYSLLMLGANPNATYRRRPVLRWVLDMADAEPLHAIPIAWILIMYGADPNTRDSEGNTLLHYVAQHCLVYGELVEDLLDRGADPNVRNKRGETPLHALFKYGNCTDDYKGRIAEALLRRGADPRIRDKDGKTPLDYAKAVLPSCR